MKNVTISLDERLYDQAKEMARERGISLSKLMVKGLEGLLGSKRMSPEEFFAVSEHLPKDREPYVWNREEIYRRD